MEQLSAVLCVLQCPLTPVDKFKLLVPSILDASSAASVHFYVLEQHMQQARLLMFELSEIPAHGEPDMVPSTYRAVWRTRPVLFAALWDFINRDPIGSYLFVAPAGRCCTGLESSNALIGKQMARNGSAGVVGVLNIAYASMRSRTAWRLSAITRIGLDRCARIYTIVKCTNRV